MTSHRLTTLRLAIANLAHHPGRTIALLLIVALFTFALLAGTMISAHLESGLQSLSARMGADLLVVPQGQGKKIENVLLRAEPSSFYLPESIASVVASVPGVTASTGQVFISSMDAQCCTVKVQLIGIDQKTDFVVSPWLHTALNRPLKDDEVIVGNFIFGEVGSTLKFYGHEFRIAAQLDPTGMGFDASIFMTIESARKLAEQALPQQAAEIAKSYSAILVRVDPHTDPMKVTDGIMDQLGLAAGVNFVYASSLMTDTSARLDRFVGMLFGCASALWALAIVILLIVFFYAYNERQAEFCLLRTLGATRSKIIALILTESLIIGLLGTVIGMAAGSYAVSAFAHSIAQTLGLPSLAPGWEAWAQALAITLAAGLITCPLASLQSVWKLSRRDILTAMREA